jgi:hypothetical protein
MWMWASLADVSKVCTASIFDPEDEGRIYLDTLTTLLT